MSETSRNFPCKHSIYEMAEHAIGDEVLSKMQPYAPHFREACDPECFYCIQETEGVTGKKVKRAKK